MRPFILLQLLLLACVGAEYGWAGFALAAIGLGVLDNVAVFLLLYAEHRRARRT